ncbi:hypothetical protein BJ742DRAFT_823891 [Cladochytrium replicatum]|nr:hypothetical protein BJ742DRAFT_823891 [Cladochytrium replicatum]
MGSQLEALTLPNFADDEPLQLFLEDPIDPPTSAHPRDEASITRTDEPRAEFSQWSQNPISTDDSPSDMSICPSIEPSSHVDTSPAVGNGDEARMSQIMRTWTLESQRIIEQVADLQKRLILSENLRSSSPVMDVSGKRELTFLKKENEQLHGLVRVQAQSLQLQQTQINTLSALLEAILDERENERLAEVDDRTVDGFVEMLHNASTSEISRKSLRSLMCGKPLPSSFFANDGATTDVGNLGQRPATVSAVRDHSIAESVCIPSEPKPTTSLGTSTTSHRLDQRISPPAEPPSPPQHVPSSQQQPSQPNHASRANSSNAAIDKRPSSTVQTPATSLQSTASQPTIRHVSQAPFSSSLNAFPTQRSIVSTTPRESSSTPLPTAKPSAKTQPSIRTHGFAEKSSVVSTVSQKATSSAPLQTTRRTTQPSTSTHSHVLPTQKSAISTPHVSKPPLISSATTSSTPYDNDEILDYDDAMDEVVESTGFAAPVAFLQMAPCTPKIIEPPPVFDDNFTSLFFTDIDNGDALEQVLRTHKAFQPTTATKELLSEVCTNLVEFLRLDAVREACPAIIVSLAERPYRPFWDPGLELEACLPLMERRAVVMLWLVCSRVGKTDFLDSLARWIRWHIIHFAPFTHQLPLACRLSRILTCLTRLARKESEMRTLVIDLIRELAPKPGSTGLTTRTLSAWAANPETAVSALLLVDGMYKCWPGIVLGPRSGGGSIVQTSVANVVGYMRTVVPEKVSGVLCTWAPPIEGRTLQSLWARLTRLFAQRMTDSGANASIQPGSPNRSSPSFFEIRVAVSICATAVGYDDQLALSEEAWMDANNNGNFVEGKTI